MLHSTSARRIRIVRVASLMLLILVLKVTAGIVTNYPSYLPPDFESDFLSGRQSYFFGPYRWAFYGHIASGPVSIVLGLLLVSDPMRRWSPSWHRRLGWAQTVIVVLVLVPTGLWMAFHAAAGPLAGLSLGTLAVLTGSCVVIGIRKAMARRFAEHRRWMWRTLMLLGSAILLRVFGGFGVVSGFGSREYDIIATWLSWILPLGVFEWLVNRPGPQT